ncbi:translation elongation factor Ts [Candidatus Pelagibacter sp.]|nr:translation elongation factor Ts [Candidatus Pelagibacter sp.]
MSDIEKVKQLRKSTGAGFKDCNAALKESNGDLDKAAEILRVKGIAKASKKMSRSATEGVVVVTGDEKKMSMIEVNCETDFVAKNDDFIGFVKELSFLNNNFSSKIDDLQKSKMKNNKTVDENLVALIAKIGEKITIGRSKTLNVNNSRNFVYQHSVIKDNVSKLVVIVSLNTIEKSDKIDLFGKQLSMHIAASNPLALNVEDIDQEIMDKEANLIAEELKNSGKSDEIVKKISLGKINKFKEENSLMTQDWVMDPKMKVKNVISSLDISNLNINEFVRIKIGE